MANKKRKKQSHSDRYQGYKDDSPNTATRIWVKDKNPVHSSRVASKDLVDYDYLHKLSKKDRKWLEKFTKEYYFDQFDSGKRHLHKKKERTKLRNDNNKRRRGYILADSEPLEFSGKKRHISVEDATIDYIDSKKNQS